MFLAADELQLTDLLDYLQQELIANHENFVMDHLIELFQTLSSLKSCKKLYRYCEDAIAAYLSFSLMHRISLSLSMTDSSLC